LVRYFAHYTKEKKSLISIGGRGIDQLKQGQTLVYGSSWIHVVFFNGQNEQLKIGTYNMAKKHIARS
jgi:hypothetical protein